MNSSRVLVTGHTGFVGSALVRRLKEQGNTVVGASASNGCFLETPNALDDIDGNALSRVYHVAGRTFVPESWEYPHLFYQTNVMGTQTVLDFCRRYGLPLLYISAYVYGSPSRLPISEEHPHCPDNPYAHSKVLAENLCRFYADKFGVSVTIARPFNIYGPGQPEQFLLPRIIRQALTENTITVANTVSRRDFVFIDDVADALVFLAAHQHNSTIYNICSGYSLSVAEVVGAVCETLGKKCSLHSENVYRPNEVLDVVGSASNILSLGWKPMYTFTQGLAITIESLRRGEGK